MKEKKIFNKNYVELTGCIHNHSEYSYDSQVKIKDIISAAQYNKLDYVTINDHMNMDAKNDADLMRETSVKLIVGVEINDKSNNNHCLVFNTNKIVTHGNAKEYTDYYTKEKAITFAAHPFEKRSNKSFRKYIWTDKSNTNFNGLEIWNAVSNWLERLNPKLNGVFLVFFPSFFIRSANPNSIKWWDYLNEKGLKKSAIGSTDAHTFLYKKFGKTFRFLPHKYLFGTIRTNVLIPQKENIDNNDILNALKNGNSYIINYKVGHPIGFYAGISKTGYDSAIFGQEIDFTEGLKFYFHAPYLVKAICYKNGKPIGRINENKGEFAIPEKGNYRLKLRRFGKNWIYTNNIYVK